MSLLPKENYCRFCTMVFCCADCRLKHENQTHPEQLEFIIREGLIETRCYICNGMPLPFSYINGLDPIMKEHVKEFHLPLQCDKCLKRFETIEELDAIGKCCKVNENGEIVESSKTKRKMPMTKDSEEEFVGTPKMKFEVEIQPEQAQEEKKIEIVSAATLSKKTSTPLQQTFESPMAMQLSSINYISNSSDEFSPPIAPKNDQGTPSIASGISVPAVVIEAPVPSPPAPVSPKKKFQTSRQRMPVHNTPLRQIMTKSIQRAIATHGHYKNFGIQQRRMSFDSSSSSYEQTISLMKLQVESHSTPNEISANETSAKALDLRMSPALRRDPNTQKVIHEAPEMAVEKFEEVEVVLRRRESDSSLLTIYQSCISEGVSTPKQSVASGRSASLKKTISFETPANIDRTPAMLMPKISNNNDSDDEDVFYTPQGTPLRPLASPGLTATRRWSQESGIDASDLAERIEELKKSPKKATLWTWVQNAANYAKRSTAASSEALEGEESPKKKKKLSSFGRVLRRAVGYLGKNSANDSEEENLLKRKRESNSSATSEQLEEVDDKQEKSPKNKKRRIQGRKPIERMRNISFDQD